MNAFHRAELNEKNANYGNERLKSENIYIQRMNHAVIACSTAVLGNDAHPSWGVGSVLCKSIYHKGSVGVYSMAVSFIDRMLDTSIGDQLDYLTEELVVEDEVQYSKFCLKE